MDHLRLLRPGSCCWTPFVRHLCSHELQVALLCTAERVRTAEAACCARMNRVRAANMALQFAIVPVSAFVTFSVVRRQLLLPLTHCIHSDIELVKVLSLHVVELNIIADGDTHCVITSWSTSHN